MAIAAMSVPSARILRERSAPRYSEVGTRYRTVIGFSPLLSHLISYRTTSDGDNTNARAGIPVTSRVRRAAEQQISGSGRHVLYASSVCSYAEAKGHSRRDSSSSSPDLSLYFRSSRLRRL